MSKITKSIKYDETIMNELLSQPGVRENVLKMKPAELNYFKELLVSQGIYARYVKERKEGGNVRRNNKN